MKDFLFFKSEKEKRSYDRFLKKKSQRNQIFIVSITTSYLCIDSLVYLVSWLLDPDISDNKEVIILVEFLKIIGFSSALLFYYLMKRFVIMKFKSKKILYLDVLMYFLKLIYFIIYLEGEFYILPYLRSSGLDDDTLFFLVTMGLKLAMIEACFLSNYFRWATKLLSMFSTCIYLTFRITTHITFQISSTFAFTIFMIIIILKLEKDARRFFITQETQGSFLASADKFKYIFENLHEKIIEKFFNKSAEGFLFIDKDFKNYHHNEKITEFFNSPAQTKLNLASKPPTQNKCPNIVYNKQESKTPNQTLFIEKTSENTLKNTAHVMEKTAFTEKNEKPKPVELFLGSKLIALKEGPEFLQKFFQDSNLKILNKLQTSNSPPKKQVVGFQSNNASIENINSVANLFQKYSNAISLQMLCNYFIKKKSRNKEKSRMSSFSKMHTINKFTASSNPNNILQEEDYHALVEISFLFYDEKKMIFKEKSFEVMIFPIFKSAEVSHFFFLVQDLGLETMIKQLQLENQNKSKTLAFVSHEMRTPLNCTKGMLHMIKEVISPEYLNSYVMPALTSSEFLLNLLNDLLDISQIQNGKFKLVHLEFNLRILMTDVLILFNFMARSKGINIFFTWDEKIPDLIKSDANRIRQIVTNLIGNAMKFTQKGSITLHASLETKDNTLILVQVIDTGVGIKDENKEKLFQAFGKVDSDENEYLNAQGVGLGLLISNILAKNLGPSLIQLKKLNMNAGLNMTSKYGDGTTFKFLIEDKNETDVISIGTKTQHQIAPINDVKLIDFLNKKINNGSMQSIEKVEEKEEPFQNNSPCRRLASSESIKKSRKSRSFIPLGFNKDNKDDKNFSSNNSMEKKAITHYKTLVVNDIVSSRYNKKEYELSDFHLETDEEVIKKKLEICENNCPKILICDDDYFNLLVLENFLHEFKVKLEKANNGFEAVEKVKNLYNNNFKCCRTFQLIFLDIEMPEKNGFETCKEIIQFMEENHEESPLIIATTGHTEQEEINKIKECGMRESIPKPIPKKEMIKVMRKLLTEKNPN